jgi:CRISPR/Cas system CSM-associated protein Csm4 (group 5 of RAMP superfamily)
MLAQNTRLRHPYSLPPWRSSRARSVFSIATKRVLDRHIGSRTKVLLADVYIPQNDERASKTEEHAGLGSRDGLNKEDQDCIDQQKRLRGASVFYNNTQAGRQIAPVKFQKMDYTAVM